MSKSEHEGKSDQIFTNSQILSLVDAILVKKLKILNDPKASIKSKAVVWKWVREPFVKGVPLPFTFQACCIMVGVDYDEYRSIMKTFLMKQRLFHAIATESFVVPEDVSSVDVHTFIQQTMFPGEEEDIVFRQRSKRREKVSLGHQEGLMFGDLGADNA